MIRSRVRHSPGRTPRKEWGGGRCKDAAHPHIGFTGQGEPEEGNTPTPGWLWAFSAILVVAMVYYLVRFGGSFSVAAHEVEQPGLAAAQRSTVPVKGDEVFSAVCGACHQRHGRGIPGTYPPLVASPWLLRDTYSPIRIVLAGLYGRIEVNGAMFNNRMPPLGDKLSDEEIAAALSHARSSWGNRALRITRSDVKSVRESSPLRGPWTPPELQMAPPPSMRPGNVP